MVGEDLLLSSDFLLDTGIVIRHLRNDNRAHDLLSFLENNGRINVSVITYLEILLGCRPHEVESTKLLFERLPLIGVEVIDFTNTTLSLLISDRLELDTDFSVIVFLASQLVS